MILRFFFSRCRTISENSVNAIHCKQVKLNKKKNLEKNYTEQKFMLKKVYEKKAADKIFLLKQISVKIKFSCETKNR